MKRTLVIGAVIVLFLIILALVLVKVFGNVGTPVQSNPSLPGATLNTSGSRLQQPDQFVKSFYVWYIANIAQDVLFPRAETRDAMFQPWLAPRFINSWSEIITQTDADPVLLAQDNPTLWGSAMSASVTSSTGSTSTVDLSIGSGASLHTFVVQLVKAADGTWRIDSVSNGS